MPASSQMAAYNISGVLAIAKFSSEPVRPVPRRVPASTSGDLRSRSASTHAGQHSAPPLRQIVSFIASPPVDWTRQRMTPCGVEIARPPRCKRTDGSFPGVSATGRRELAVDRVEYCSVFCQSPRRLRPSVESRVTTGTRCRPVGRLIHARRALAPAAQRRTGSPQSYHALRHALRDPKPCGLVVPQRVIAWSFQKSPTHRSG